MGIHILIKTALVYFFILIVLKIMGKREIGQLSLFDFVILLMIADVAVMGIDNEEIPFYFFLLAITILAVIQKTLSFVLLKIPGLRDFFDGKESVIIIDGKVNIKEMRKQNYNFNDLVVQLRLKNIRSLSEVRYLILETNGEISVFKYDEFNNTPSVNIKSKTNDTTATKQLTNQTSDKDIYPFPIILSGKVCKDNIKLLNISEKWIIKKIKEKGYEEINDIYYATYEDGDLFILEVYKF